MSASNVTEPGVYLELLGRIMYEVSAMRPLVPTYLHLITSAIFPIWIAAHASLNRPSSAAKPIKKKTSDADADDEDEEADQKIESLTPSDAILFPVLAGCTLASLYFILKWLQDPAWLNWALGIYFSWIGLFFTFKFVKDLFGFSRSFGSPTTYSAKGQLWTIDLAKSRYKSDSGVISNAPYPGVLRLIRFGALEKRIWSFRRGIYTKCRLDLHIHRLISVKAGVGLHDVFAIIIALAVVAYNTFIDKPWYLTNFLGFSFCYGALQFTTPTTGWTGTLILSALFFYDIYFVFFTPMMVTVATKLDVPIKLLFPRPDGCILPLGAMEGSLEMEKYIECLTKKRAMAMLGLGDIVVPGMMIAFALRFDLYLHYLKLQQKVNIKDDDITKAVYLPATGGWGERFWTKRSLQPAKLRAKSFKKTYFYATVLGYIAGMITTVVVMQVAAHAQPALLYLVPGVVGSFWGTALLRGQFKLLWNYTEASEDEKKDEVAKKEQGEEKESTSKNEVTANGVVKASTDISDDGKASQKDTRSISSPISSKSTQEAKPKPKTADPELSCRKLIAFSITLPDKPPPPSNAAQTVDE